MNLNPLRIPRSAVRRGGLLLGALVSTVMLASPAHAEKDVRVCGAITKSNSYPSEAVGFIMKVQKNDATTCQSALNLAMLRFEAAGGANDVAVANRIWRRVRGHLGPFHGKSVYSQTFRRTTCETFSWDVAQREREDLCFKIPRRNKLYAMASTATGEFALRGE